MASIEEQINNACQPGQILHLYCGFTNPPKPKFLVIVSIEPLLLFIINSRINNFKQTHPEHLACQIKISCVEHSCLENDSYIDCTEVITCFDLERIKTILSTNITDIKTILSSATKQEIIMAVTTSKLLSPIHKTNVIAGLS